MTDELMQAADAEFFQGVDWLDREEATLALDSAEAAFAECCYIERHPPIPSEFVGSYTKAMPEFDEPAWPIWAKYKLLLRCMIAAHNIRARDETYRYYRDIYTPEAREAARGRRVRAKAAARRYRESGDPAALEEMLQLAEEMHAERGAS